MKILILKKHVKLRMEVRAKVDLLQMKIIMLINKKPIQLMRKMMTKKAGIVEKVKKLSNLKDLAIKTKIKKQIKTNN